ncbi:PREDICTED: transmembrane protease serine 9-like [Chrysochloris asiatica]|uniref:Transmembrane protease serine 9-like n=1 Tax=Chrysochloris asiatica TaxID=185453 RepID=A0A9B0X0D9_CHRAS|nr:PREDICTED: transmembrane protease serine 9-like [Chrysochloris asiatica]
MYPHVASEITSPSLAGFAPSGTLRGDSRIVGGHEVAPHSRPFMASLQLNKTHICGAVLVQRRWVLTAAHCEVTSANLSAFRVVLGAHALQTPEPTWQVFTITQAVPYPLYNAQLDTHDLQLLKVLNASAHVTRSVRPTRLPRRNYSLRPGTRCRVTGWGDTTGREDPPAALLEAAVVIEARGPCNASWGGALTVDMLCASARSMDRRGVCGGDSGGPLLCRGQLHGLVSFSSSLCGDPRLPDVYTRVSTFTPMSPPAHQRLSFSLEPQVAGLSSAETPYLSPLLPPEAFPESTPGSWGGRIIGGHEVTPHSRPYMVSVSFGGQHHCGGFLLHAQWVVSAAHCFSDRNPLMGLVVLGAHDLRTVEPTQQIFSILKVFRHPNYQPSTHTNDICLLKLNHSAVLGREVGLLKLPRRGARLPQPGEWCQVAGWGSVSDFQEPPSGLMEAKVRVLDLNFCNRSWSGQLRPAMFCTRSGDHRRRGFCSADSGGPLVCRGKAYGLVSFSGLWCGDPKYPDVYTQLSAFVNWIRGIVRRNPHHSTPPGILGPLSGTT